MFIAMAGRAAAAAVGGRRETAAAGTACKADTNPGFSRRRECDELCRGPRTAYHVKNNASILLSTGPCRLKKWQIYAAGRTMRTSPAVMNINQFIQGHD